MTIFRLTHVTETRLYCSFLSKKSQQCLDVAFYNAARGANVATFDCEGQPDQRFRWVTEKWSTPIATWKLVACSQNGEVKQSVSNQYTYSEGITSEMAGEISSTIEAGVDYFVASVTVSLTAKYSNSLAKSWEESYSRETSIELTCSRR